MPTLTTTFNLLREAKACTSGYRKLATHLGGVEAYGADTPVNLLTILESNGVADMLWCLQATQQEGATRVASQLAIEFASEVLPLFEKRYSEDARPRKAIEAAKSFMAGECSHDDLLAARRAAYAAVAAADAVAADADAYAADADAVGTKVRERQAKIIKMILTADEKEAV